MCIFCTTLTKDLDIQNRLCNGCEKSYGSCKISLEKVIFKKEIKGEPIKTEIKSEPSVHCEICNLKFDDSDDLNSHKIIVH